MDPDALPTPDEQIDAVCLELIATTSPVRRLLARAEANPHDVPELHRVHTATDLLRRLTLAVAELERHARAADAGRDGAAGG